MRSNTSLLALALTLSTLCVANGQTSTGPVGRYGAVMEYDPSHAPAQTVYRPRDIGNLKKIPVIAWGNGGCAANGGANARQFLMQVASEGYLIIAPAKPGPDPEPVPAGAMPQVPAAAPAGNAPAMPAGPAPTVSAELNTAIDWAIGENSRKGSLYYGKLDTRQIAVMGHSCGGLQALEASIDPRVVTGMIWNSGTFSTDTPLRGTTMNKEKLKQLHVPLAYIHGGPTDIAYQNSLDDFERITVPVFMGEIGVGHGGTFREINGGEYSKVATAWLNWRLKGDKSAGAMFTGANCTLCTDSRWKVSRKGMN